MERVASTGALMMLLHPGRIPRWTYTSLEADALQSFINRIRNGESGRDRIGELDAVFLQSAATLLHRLQDAYGFPVSPAFERGVPIAEANVEVRDEILVAEREVCRGICGLEDPDISTLSDWGLAGSYLMASMRTHGIRQCVPNYFDKARKLH